MAYAITGIFFDLPTETLEEIRDNALAALTTGGKTLVSWSIGGKSFTHQFIPGFGPAEILAEAQAAIRRANGTRITKTFSDFRVQR